jgi:hypothetical protein
MRTVYLLKNCPKSFGVLLKLVKMGEITTNIVIVDKFYSTILKRDKRVKSFPFVINTFPTIRGLIPKIAKVIPFRMYFTKCKLKCKPKCKLKCKYARVITYMPPKFIRSPRFIINPKKILNPRYIVNSNPRKINKKPIIKAIKQKDESINIILCNK